MTPTELLVRVPAVPVLGRAIKEPARPQDPQIAEGRGLLELDKALLVDRDLKQRVADGAFREDLYFRLNVITVEMPPLRDRPGDLVTFAEHYLKHFAALCGRRLDGFSEGALAGIRAYPWPGNLRELRNAIERAVIMAKGAQINLEDLPAELRGHKAPGGNGNGSSVQVGSLVSMEKVEEAHLRRILEQTSNLAEAAQVLEIDQATLYRKRKKIGLE